MIYKYISKIVFFSKMIELLLHFINQGTYDQTSVTLWRSYDIQIVI